MHRLAGFRLAEAFQDPGDLGEQVGPSSGELAQRGHGGGLLSFGEFTPLRVVPGLAVQLRDEGTVSFRTVIAHVF